MEPKHVRIARQGDAPLFDDEAFVDPDRDGRGQSETEESECDHSRRAPEAPTETRGIALSSIQFTSHVTTSIRSTPPQAR